MPACQCQCHKCVELTILPRIAWNLFPLYPNYTGDGWVNGWVIHTSIPLWSELFTDQQPLLHLLLGMLSNICTLKQGLVFNSGSICRVKWLSLFTGVIFAGDISLKQGLFYFRVVCEVKWPNLLYRGKVTGRHWWHFSLKQGLFYFRSICGVEWPTLFYRGKSY